MACLKDTSVMKILDLPEENASRILNLMRVKVSSFEKGFTTITNRKLLKNQELQCIEKLTDL